jgi:hypothetical protein
MESASASLDQSAISPISAPPCAAEAIEKTDNVPYKNRTILAAGGRITFPLTGLARVLQADQAVEPGEI